MTALIQLIDAHGSALEHDLFRLGRSLSELGRSMTWASLLAWVENETGDTALNRAMAGEDATWHGTERVCFMLADLIDCVNASRVDAARMRGASAEIQPYPRPWMNQDEKTEEECVSKEDFEAWLGVMANG